MRKLIYKLFGDAKSMYGKDGTYVKNMPSVNTVGELIEVLRQLPAKLPVDSNGDEEGVKPVWFNVGCEDEHLAIKEGDGAWGD